MNKYIPLPITLQESRDLDSKPVTKLTMRPPTTDDVILAQQHASKLVGGEVVTDTQEAEAHLFAALTGTTREFIGSLAFYDHTQLQQAYDCFLLPLPQFAARSALLFPSSAEEPQSETSDNSA